MKLILISFLSLFTIQSYACNEPTNEELKAFFGYRNWVRTNSNGKSLGKVLGVMKLDFSNRTNSYVRAGAIRGNVARVCKLSGNRMKVIAPSGRSVTISKHGRGVKAKIDETTYYYSPETLLKADASKDLYRGLPGRDKSPAHIIL